MPKGAMLLPAPYVGGQVQKQLQIFITVMAKILNVSTHLVNTEMIIIWD